MILTPDNEYAAVLDACVLIPMPLCDTLLRLAEEPATFRPLWSEEILAEISRGMQKSLGRTEAQGNHRIEQMKLAFPEALVTYPSDFVKAFDCIPDPRDRHVLAAAVQGDANAVVTFNVRHFPEECLAKYELLRQTPDDFLVHQYHLCSESVLEKLDTQAANIGTDRLAIIGKLRIAAPNFVKLIEERST